MQPRLRLNIEPYKNDPGHWGNSLVANAEVIVPLLEAAGARSVGEVGSYAGDLTRLLLEWAAQRDATVWAIDPMPQPQLEELDATRTDLELVRLSSVDALNTIPMPDAVVLDGDHNYFTVSEELRIIGERAPGAKLPLLLFHDVRWPHARRDSYYTPELIPEEHRQPIVEGGGVYPGNEGLTTSGLPYQYPAAHEGGPANGVLTAVEDFVAANEGLRLAVFPSFFGLGVVWHQGAEWADAVAAVIDPLDGHPVLERLEANRVLHLANVHAQRLETHKALERARRTEDLLQRMLGSGVFTLAEKLSGLRHRGAPTAISREEIRRALEGR